jgi:hypothetical protein
MARLSYLLPALCLVIAACENKGSDQETSHIEKPVQGKPIVAVVPMFDSSESGLSWDPSYELTVLMREKLYQNDRLYMVSPDKVKATLKKLKASHDPFAQNTNWIKSTFAGSEFVAFMELIEHEEIPTYEGDSPANLSMKVRIRVFDIRGEHPKAILQEVVHDVQHTPKAFNKNNFYQVPLGDELYPVSPLGMAHEELAEEVAARIQDYILISCLR